MYRLILVEDEEKIRSGLKNLIDWNDMGFEAVADFSDGEQALEFIARHPVDVVLTDIRMEHMSGIELAKNIRERRIPVSIIFLSGFKDFEYARSAIAYGVGNYILKPVKLNELYRVFQDLRDKLANAARSPGRSAGLWADAETRPYLQEQFYFDLLIGAVKGQDQLIGRMAAADIRDVKKYYRIAVVRVRHSDKWSYGEENIPTAEWNIIHGVKPPKLDFMRVQLGRAQTVVYMQGNDGGQLRLESDVAVREIKADFLSLIGIDADIGLSGVYDDLLMSPSAYMEARRNILPQENAPGAGRAQTAAMLRDDCHNLAGCVFRGDAQAAENMAEKIVDCIVSADTDENEIKNHLVRIISVVERKIRSNLSPGEEFCNFDYSIIYRAGHVMQARQPIVSYFMAAAGYFDKYCSQSDQKILLRAKEYILQNYSRNISLSQAAEYVYLSPTHFSRVFKKLLGENFIDYLTRIRMETAKELLADRRNRVYEIAEKVGYGSQKYFSRLFRQYAGMSPTEYQEKVCGSRAAPGGGEAAG